MSGRTEPGETQRLRGQVAALRAQVARLTGELASARGLLAAGSTADLVEANGRLVISALHAEEAAESASSELGELMQTSQRDALTGTPNRALLVDRLQGAIAQAKRRGNRVAVLFLDLDGFKPINDSYGHAAGDVVLCVVARRLEAALRESDTVSRYGGDEFAILLADVAQREDVCMAAQKILLAVAAPTRFGQLEQGLSCSIGVAIFPEDGEDPETLIACADAAMYRSKRRSPGGFALHGNPSVRDTA